MIEVIKHIGLVVGVPVVRSLFGWVENSLADGVINEFEWRQLGETTIRVGLIAIATYYSLGQFFNVDVVSAGASALLVDKVLSAMKKKK